MNKKIFIHSFQVVLPSENLPQEKTVSWILKTHKKFEEVSGEKGELLSEKILRRFALSEKYIARRYYDCPEVDEDWERHNIYKLTESSPLGATMGERNIYFNSIVQRVFNKIYHEKIPSHLIHVTCTGYLSPSPPQIFFAEKLKRPSITHAYHMGCYASLPTVRLAMGLAVTEEKDVDVVHTELCSLHLDPSSHTPEQIVVQTLFADGHIKYSVGNHSKGFQIINIKELLLPASSEDMCWIPDSYGMRMSLSKEVPVKIRDNIFSFLKELCDEGEVTLQEILSEAIFAIHPGGPKIIEAIQKKLELRNDQVEASKRILYERGNMSSATLPHIWNKILTSHAKDKQIVVSLAFGPGLTLFGALFEVRL